MNPLRGRPEGVFLPSPVLPPTRGRHFASPVGGCQVLLQTVHDADKVQTFNRRGHGLLCLLLTCALRSNPVTPISVLPAPMTDLSG